MTRQQRRHPEEFSNDQSKVANTQTTDQLADTMKAVAGALTMAKPLLMLAAKSSKMRKGLFAAGILGIAAYAYCRRKQFLKST